MAEDHDYGLDGFQTALRDGTMVRLRPVMAADRGRIAAGVTQLSPNSRYMRFFTAQPQLAEDQLNRLSDIDHHNHIAWIAVDPTLPEEPGLGIGRFVHEENDLTKAEFALTVVDAHQGRGLGSVLLATLYCAAREQGVRMLRAVVMPDNRNLIQWFLKLGGSVAYGKGVCLVGMTIETHLLEASKNPSAERFKNLVAEIWPHFNPARAISVYRRNRDRAKNAKCGEARESLPMGRD